MHNHEDLRTNIDASLGIFTTMSLVLLLWGYCWLKSYTSFRIPQIINVVFTEVAGLNVNGAVFLDGVRIGVVDDIHWQGPHRVRVRLRINRPHVVVPVGSRFDILTNGIVGAKYVEVLLPQGTRVDSQLTPISEKEEVLGEDPVRPELAVNQLAIGLSNIDMDRLQHNFEADRSRLVRAADQLSILAQKAMPLADNGLPLERELLALTKDLHACTVKINSLLGSSHASKDLKEVAETARETAETLQSTVHELSMTISDKPARKDILAAVDKLDQSTLNLKESLELVKSVSDNKDLRVDVQHILIEANEALDKVDKLLRNPQFGNDVHFTLAKTQAAIGHLDLVARQLNQILNKHQPLLHLMFGRPGYLKPEKSEHSDNRAGHSVKPAKKRVQTEEIKSSQPGQEAGSVLTKLKFKSESTTESTTETPTEADR